MGTAIKRSLVICTILGIASVGSSDVITMSQSPVMDNLRVTEPGYIDATGSVVNSWSPGDIGPSFDVRFGGYQARFGQALSVAGNWGGANMMSFVMTNMESYDIVLNFAVSTNANENSFVNGYFSQITVPANSTNRYALYFAEPPVPMADMKVLPKPFEGQFIRYDGNNNCNQTNIRHWRLSCQTTAGGRVTFHSLAAVTYSLTLSGVVDQYFQYTPRTWEGKVFSDQDLFTQRDQENADLTSKPLTGFPFGSTVLPNQGASSKWRTKKYGNKWYFVHPNGRLFWSLGMNGVSDQRSTRIEGREAMFESVPSPTGPNADLYYSSTNAQGQQVTLYNLLYHNMRKKYPGSSSLREQFLQLTNRRLNSWGINTIGAWSLEEFRLANDRPFVHIMRTTGFPTHLPTPTTAWSTPPDPFHPQFQSWMVTHFTDELRELNGLSNFMGVYVDNEMSWGHNLTGSTLIDRYSLALGVLAAPSNQPAKAEFIRMLTRKYRTVSRLNAAWRMSFSSFVSLNAPISITLPSQLTTTMQRDLRDFTVRLSSAYFSKVKAALAQSGCTGLYLGCRFWHQVPEVVQVASQYVDVLTFNNYASHDQYNWAYLNSLRKPVMISEWSVNTDEGPTLGIHGITRAERENRIKLMLQTAAQQSNIIGLHWFEMYDMSVVNRGYDIENYGIGTLAVTDNPHGEVINALRWFAPQIYTLRN